MLATMAYVVMYFLRIPIWSFLKYDPKDIIIAMGGFVYGPSGEELEFFRIVEND